MSRLLQLRKKKNKHKRPARGSTDERGVGAGSRRGAVHPRNWRLPRVPVDTHQSAKTSTRKKKKNNKEREQEFSLSGVFLSNSAFALSSGGEGAGRGVGVLEAHEEKDASPPVQKSSAKQVCMPKACSP